MWSGFITGFAEKSVSLIEERDKEIRKSVNSRIEDMFKQASVSKKEAEARREELTSLANQLMGVGFDEAEARALLENPEQAESIIKLVESSPNKMADPETKRRLFQPAAERMAGYAGEKPKDYIKKIATPQRSGVPTVLPTEMRTAFGLRGPIDEGYLSSLGIKEEDLATELPAREIAKPLGLDMSVFREADTFNERKNAAQVALLEADPGSDEFKQASSTLSRISAIEDIGKDSENKLKESDVRSNLRNLENTIKEQMAGPGNLVRIANPDGSFSYGYKKGLDSSVIKSIENSRQTAITSYLREFYSVRGEIPDVVRRAAAPFLVAPGTPVKVGGGQDKEGGAPAAPTGGLPSPKSQEEYDGLPSGTRYIDTDGKVKIKS
jgi:hypothetical protein